MWGNDIIYIVWCLFTNPNYYHRQRKKKTNEWGETQITKDVLKWATNISNDKNVASAWDTCCTNIISICKNSFTDMSGNVWPGIATERHICHTIAPSELRIKTEQFTD